MNPTEKIKKDSLLTRREVAQMLKCKESTLALWAYLKRYPLPYIKFGNAIRYRLADINKFIESNVRK